MDEEYEGNVEATGEDYSVEPAESRRSFRALLDVGLVKTTTGNRVFGALKTLMEDEPEKYQSHFSEYIKRGIEADNIEEMYKKVHAAICADPTEKKSGKQPPKEHKRYNLKKLTYEERKAKLIQRLNSLNSAAGNDDEDEEDDE
ncbi:UNVERIFIED_CONTAM: 60S ribosomal protein L5 [Sesamum radiatum]|uniref:60S ribosomal protein L5 n=1 Tax=Sesamum radiatum TaxID=300843 RepID=A0AAW2UPU5_SESRA